MGYWPSSSSGILLISLTFMLYHRFMWTLQRHLGSIQQMLKKQTKQKTKCVFSKSFQLKDPLHCVTPSQRGIKTHFRTCFVKPNMHFRWKAMWCGRVSCDCDLLQIPQMAYCHDVSGSAFLLSHTDIGFSKNTALYPRVNRPQWDNTCCEIAGWKYGVTMSRNAGGLIFFQKRTPPFWHVRRPNLKVISSVCPSYLSRLILLSTRIIQLAK